VDSEKPPVYRIWTYMEKVGYQGPSDVSRPPRRVSPKNASPTEKGVDLTKSATNTFCGLGIHLYGSFLLPAQPLYCKMWAEYVNNLTLELGCLQATLMSTKEEARVPLCLR